MKRWNCDLVTTMLAIVLTSGFLDEPGAPSSRTLLKTVAVSSVGEVPTEEESWDFALAFEEALYGLDAKALSGLIDWQAIAEASTSGIKAKRAVEEGFTEGFVSRAQRGDDGLPVTLVNAINEGGSLTPLQVIPGERHPIVRSRLLTAEGSLSYLDFYLARRADDSIRVVDVFPHAVGEAVSQTVRRFYLSVVAESERSVIDRLTGKEQAFITHLPTLSEMTIDLQARRYEEVLTSYRSLPKELQDERVYLVLRFTAAAEIDEDDYVAAMDDFFRLFPNDPSANLFLIDHSYLQGKFDETLAAIDRLDEAIGGDPYLLVLRAGILMELGNLEEARAILGLALERDPRMIETFWVLITLSLLEEDYDETVQLLDLIASEFEMVFNDLTELPEYAGFVQSPQFADWQARQPAPPISQPPDEPSPVEEVETPPDF